MIPTLEEALNKSGPVYVRNATNPIGHVAINWYDAGGQTHDLILPRTKHPIDILEVMPRDILEKNQDIRHYLNVGAIEIVDPEQAAKELTKEVKDEVKQAFKEILKPTDPQPAAIAAEEEAKRKVVVEAEADTPQVCIVAEDLMKNAVTEEVAIKRLKPMFSELTSKDWGRLMAVAPAFRALAEPYLPDADKAKTAEIKEEAIQSGGKD